MAFNIISSVALAAAFAAAVVLIVMHYNTAEDIEYTAVGELLLVIVLAVEGLIALVHLHEARTERQVEVLREVMNDLSSRDALQQAQQLYVEIPWTTGHFHAIGVQPLKWEPRTGQGTEVKYSVQL